MLKFTLTVHNVSTAGTMCTGEKGTMKCSWRKWDLGLSSDVRMFLWLLVTQLKVVQLWIIECRELDWKCTFTGLNVGFTGSAWVRTSGVQLYNLLLWPYTSSRPFQGCKRLASEQSLCCTRGATVPRYHNN